MSSGLNGLPALLALGLVCWFFFFYEHIVLPFPAKKFLSVFDDCLIREISKHMENSHPADEYNDYKFFSGLPEVGVFFWLWFDLFVFLSFQPRTLSWSWILQMLRPLVSCRRPSATTSFTPEEKGRISWISKLGEGISKCWGQNYRVFTTCLVIDCGFCLILQEKKACIILLWVWTLKKVTVRLTGKPQGSQMDFLWFFISLFLDKPL